MLAAELVKARQYFFNEPLCFFYPGNELETVHRSLRGGRGPGSTPRSSQNVLTEPRPEDHPAAANPGTR